MALMDPVRAVVKTGQPVKPGESAGPVPSGWGRPLVWTTAAQLLKCVPAADSAQAQWHRSDHHKQTQKSAGSKVIAKERRLDIPPAVFEGPSYGVGHYALVDITTQSSHDASCARPLRVYLRTVDAGVSVVGIRTD